MTKSLEPSRLRRSGPRRAVGVRTVMMALARPGTIGDLAAGPVTPQAR